MTTLELKYSSNQQHQVEAVEAVCELFRGQEFLDSELTLMDQQMVETSHDTGQLPIGNLYESFALSVGHANGLRLSANQLLGE